MERNGGKQQQQPETAAPAPAPRKGAWRDGAVTYFHLLFYIAISGGQIFFNKWVLSSKEINFPYPVALTLLHMLFSSVVCFAATKIFKVIKIDEGMTTDIREFSHSNWSNVCNDTLAREQCIPLHICCICTDVEGNNACSCVSPWNSIWP
ncbi:hypothetical protein ACQJBY_068770 [Aegilops geniculata]